MKDEQLALEADTAFTNYLNQPRSSVTEIAKALAFSKLTVKGKRTCQWPDAWSPEEIRRYMRQATYVKRRLGI